MTKVYRIRIRKGAELWESTEGNIIPERRILGYQLETTAIVHYDTDGDHVYEFTLDNRQWTVAHEDVTVL